MISRRPGRIAIAVVIQSAPDHSGASAPDYHHTALFYAGEEEFVRRTAHFIRAGIPRGEPTLVVVSSEKIDRLRHELGPDGASVHYADMGDVGSNPARIIPAWQEFIEAHPGRQLRGIGEPIYPERDAAELIECQHHERLLNLALADSKLFLVCPYDTTALPAAVIAEANHSHPLIAGEHAEHISAEYAGAHSCGDLLTAPLPEPAPPPEPTHFGLGDLGTVRGLVESTATRAGLDEARSQDLVMAVNELATNSVRHGGGEGHVRLWSEPGGLICEVRDRGTIADPLAGRRRPSGEHSGGYGLWLANGLCDLVQVRTGPGLNIVRVHMRIG
jgi:anti-sigma regulatory factor (Ser/Thr protein kinase)